MADPITLEFLAAQQRRLLDEIASIRTELALVWTQKVQAAEDVRVLLAMATRQNATLCNHTDLLHRIILEQIRLGGISHLEPAGMMTATDLGVIARAYSEATEQSLAALGQEIFNDHQFFKRLLSGKDCTTQNAAKASAWFAEHWPATASWPENVPRVSRASSRHGLSEGNYEQQ